jgi:hypothetical protein
MPTAQIPGRASHHLDPLLIDRQLIRLDKRPSITIILRKGDQMTFQWIIAALDERNISNNFWII